MNRVEVWEHEKNSAIVTKEQILEGFTETPALEGNKNAPVATTVAAPSPEIQASAGGQIENVPLHTNPRPAPVGNKVTSGFSNLFAGTSWGS